MTNQCISESPVQFCKAVLLIESARRSLKKSKSTIDLPSFSVKICCVPLVCAATLDQFMGITPNIKPHRFRLRTAHRKRLFVKQTHVGFIAALLCRSPFFSFFILSSNESIFHCRLFLISSAFLHLFFLLFLPFLDALYLQPRQDWMASLPMAII